MIKEASDSDARTHMKDGLIPNGFPEQSGSCPALLPLQHPQTPPTETQQLNVTGHQQLL